MGIRSCHSSFLHIEEEEHLCVCACICFSDCTGEKDKWIYTVNEREIMGRNGMKMVADKKGERKDLISVKIQTTEEKDKNRGATEEHGRRG